MIRINDSEIVKDKFNILINDIWDFPQNKNILDNLRYIINNYYDEYCANIFWESLNKNLDYYYSYMNNNTITDSDLKELMSKYIIIFTIIKLENIGIFKKIKCSGKGYFAQVRKYMKLFLYIYVIF